MSSKKIILNYSNKKNSNNYENNQKQSCKLNEHEKDILKEYLKENFQNIIETTFIDTLKTNYLSKIQQINYFKSSKKYTTYLKNFNYVYNKLILPYSENLFSYDKKKIQERYEDFFKKQENIQTKQIFSLINYQYIFIKHFEKHINILVQLKTHFIHSEIHDFSKPYEENKDIKNFISEYINDFNIQKLPTKKEIKKHELSEEDQKIFNVLTNITQNIIKKLLKLVNNEDFKTNEKQLIIYGSYTSFLLNHNVSYNDIDLYHTNSLKFLTIIMIIFYFILDIKVDIFKIPYVLGHLSLRYKNNHFVDCIYLDKYTLNNIPSIDVKNINIIDPIVQMFNNFRMMSEIFRLNNVTEKKEETINKYCALLDKSNEKLKIDFNNLFEIKHPLKFELIDSSFILINLKAGFQDFEEYKKTKKNNKHFDYLIISFTEPKILFQMIQNRDDIRISKQYFALFNEICIEFENKKKNTVIESKNNVLLNKQPIQIQESDVEILTKKIIYKIPLEIEEIINNNNVLLMTNISTNLYIKNYITKEKLCEKILISNISKETILSSFVLYNILKKNNEELTNFYIKYFLSFLKTNKKYDEFKLFNEQSDYEKIIKHSKIKICGNHETFSLYDLSYKNLFFFNIQDKDYYDYDEFIVLTNYNENLKIK